MLMPATRTAHADDVPKLDAIERAAAAIFRDVGLAWIAEGEISGAAYLAGLCEQQMLWVAIDDGAVPVEFLAAERRAMSRHGAVL
jgi:hypothetical protein